MRFLLVDDSRTVHMYIKACLSSKDNKYDDAFDGAEGLQMVKDNKYDIILLDWEMPNMDGPTALKEMRKFDPNTPIVMVTTKNNPEDIMRVIETGATEYIMKPFTKEILAEKLSTILGREVA